LLSGYKKYVHLTQQINTMTMKTEVRNRIIESNKAVVLLTSNGFTCIGATKDFKSICVLDKSGKQLFYKDFIEASNSLLN